MGAEKWEATGEGSICTKRNAAKPFAEVTFGYRGSHECVATDSDIVPLLFDMMALVVMCQECWTYMRSGICSP